LAPSVGKHFHPGGRKPSNPQWLQLPYGFVIPVLRPQATKNDLPMLTNPVTNTPGSIWFAGLNRARTQSFETKTNAMPRLGFAWQASDNWVVRGELANTPAGGAWTRTN